MNAHHEFVAFTFGGLKRFAIWKTNGDDGFVFENGELVTSNRFTDVQSYAINNLNNINLDPPLEYDLDVVESACNSDAVNTLAIKTIRDVWNIAADLNSSSPTPCSRFLDLSDNLSPLHDRTGLMADPCITDDEMAILNELLLAAVSLITQHFRPKAR